MKITKRKMVAALRQHGYKLTPQRRAVIQVIASSQGHLTPAAIYKKISKENPDIGLVTIYRTLEILTKLKLICELHTKGSCPSYAISTLEHHHHLICGNCGKVTDFSGYDLDELEQRLSLETGFKINSHVLEFTGLCRVCQKEVD